uniref:surface-adhesin E family protein n=1 Tax=Polynucleobacter sp. TaxID=2029855 RepID=UPI004048AAE4
MKKLLFICAFSLLSSNAFAEWTVYAKAGSDTYYVDMSTQRKVDAYINVWTLADYTSPKDGALSAKIYYQVSCKEDKYRFLSLVDTKKNMGDGEVLITLNQRSDWFYVVPNSVVAGLTSLICK